MANLVKLYGNRIELPYQSLQYSFTPPAQKLQAGLEAYQALLRDAALQRVPAAEREQIARFLYQFGYLLYRTLFPEPGVRQVLRDGPLLLELHQDWAPYPWELLNDGQHWLALTQGVLRFGYPPVPGAQVCLPAGPLRVLGASAEPLPLGADSRVGRDTAQVGTGFIANLPHLATPPAEPDAPEDAEAPPAPPLHYHHLDHATAGALEDGIARHPDVLLLSGFAAEEGWYLESERLTAQAVSWEWLLRQLRAAALERLRVVVVADSMGLLQPLTAAHRTREILRAGVPAVIRMDGLLTPPEQQRYLRTLLDGLASGAPVESAHRTAVRRLFRQVAEGWVWSCLRLYPQAIPSAGAAYPQVDATRTAPTAMLTASGELAPGLLALDAPPTERAQPSFGTAPAPPHHRPDAAHPARSAELRKLAAAVLPEEPPTSPLVFLSGPAGSGKTALALDLARRVRRRFDEVLYLNERALLPDLHELLPVQQLPRPERPAGQPLLGALIRHLRGAAAANGALGEWKEALVRHSDDGRNRLVIVDRLEQAAGYDAFCEALSGLPRTMRVLLVSRAKPPLVPGTYLEQTPVSMEELQRLLGADAQPVQALTRDVPALAALLCTDLFLARLLARAPCAPQTADLVDAAAEAREGHPAAGVPGTRLLRALVAGTLPALSEAAREAATVLAFFPRLVERSLLGHAAELPPPALTAALEELQAVGWAESHDGGRYWSLASRLHGTVGEHLLTLGALSRLQARLARAYAAWLDGMAAHLADAHATARHQVPPLLAWSDAPPTGATPEAQALWTRLGVERANLAELVLLLVDTGDHAALARLAELATPLQTVAELEDLWELVHHGLLASAELRADAVGQAHALNRAAAPQVEGPLPAKATPVLERALELLQGQPAGPVLGETYCLLARGYERTGRSDAAESLLHSAAELGRQLHDAALVGRAALALPRIWRRKRAEPPDAERFLTRQAQYLREHGRLLEATLVVRAQAEARFAAGQQEAALARFEEVLGTCRALGAAGEAGHTLLRMAECTVAAGDAERAFQLLAEAGREAGTAGLDLEEQGQVLSAICRLFEQEGAARQALEGYLRIRDVLREIGDREALIGVLDRIGGLYYQLGEQGKSTQCYEERLHLQATLSPS